MKTFSFDVSYAKTHSVYDAIVQSYCELFQVSRDKINIEHMYDVTGLKCCRVEGVININECTENLPNDSSHSKLSATQTCVFAPKKIQKTSNTKRVNYADAICKVLPSLVVDETLLAALNKWVHVIYKSGKGITKEQVVMAVEELTRLCGDDTNKAVEVVKRATQAGYKVFEWCMPSSRSTPTPLMHNSDFVERTSTTVVKISDEAF